MIHYQKGQIVSVPRSDGKIDSSAIFFRYDGENEAIIHLKKHGRFLKKNFLLSTLDEYNDPANVYENIEEPSAPAPPADGFGAEIYAEAKIDAEAEVDVAEHPSLGILRTNLRRLALLDIRWISRVGLILLAGITLFIFIFRCKKAYDEVIK